MDTQHSIQQRKEAVHLYYYQHWSKASICQHLHCSRPWLDRWLNRYDPDAPDTSLQNRSSRPHTSFSPWAEETRQHVEDMRRTRMQREQWPYALYGAATIHHELDHLQRPEIPPIRTIHRWFTKANLVPSQQLTVAPASHYDIPMPMKDEVNWRQQLDLKGPLYVQGDSHKYYILVLRDGWSHRCALQAAKSREALGIAAFLTHSWAWLGMPVYLQMDNALEFQDSLRYPRSFGRVVRVALDLGIEPLFNPPGEPWFNGGVERHNGFLDERVCRLVCADFQTLQQEVQHCQTACNSTHRVASLTGRTPDEVAATASLRLLAPDYQRYQMTLPQSQGFVSFIRRVRKSGRITLGPHDRFMIDPELVATYVWARVDLARRRVSIAQHDTLLKTYDFSPETVGQWAGDTETTNTPHLNNV